MDISDFKNMNVLIVGLGLMGSAFADAMRPLAPKRIFGVDIDENILQVAEETGLIDEGVTDASRIIDQCDLIIVCLYLNDAITFIRENMDLFKAGCIITDVVGVKRKIIDALLQFLRKDIDYIPGHPMAGKEKQGVFSPDRSIFLGRNYILTPLPCNKRENLEFLKQIIYAIGFKYIVTTDPQEHDQKIAFTSQLCHIIAASMVDINNDESVVHYEGGSYRDMTRIAMVNSKMWGELFFANEDMLIEEIERLQKSIQAFKDFIIKEDPQIINKLEEIKDKRERLNNL
ncbi:MAG: prephenate dehydrogenase [Eubacteriales bacterium]